MIKITTDKKYQLAKDTAFEAGMDFGMRRWSLRFQSAVLSASKGNDMIFNEFTSELLATLTNDNYLSSEDALNLVRAIGRKRDENKPKSKKLKVKTRK